MTAGMAPAIAPATGRLGVLWWAWGLWRRRRWLASSRFAEGLASRLVADPNGHGASRTPKRAESACDRGLRAVGHLDDLVFGGWDTRSASTQEPACSRNSRGGSTPVTTPRTARASDSLPPHGTSSSSAPGPPHSSRATHVGFAVRVHL